MAWPSEGPFVAKMLKPRMSAWGHLQTLGDLVSDVRFGAVSGRKTPTRRNSGRLRLLSSGKQTSQRDLTNVGF